MYKTGCAKRCLQDLWIKLAGEKVIKLAWTNDDDDS